MRLRAVALVVSFSFVSSAFASTVIDQQNTAFNSYLGPSTTPGQSFTPSASSIDFVTFELATSDPTDGALVYVNLLSGNGFGGTLLGTSGSMLVQAGSFEDFTFNFSSTVALMSGIGYTFQVVDSSGATLYEGESSGNAYAGGDEYDSGGVLQSGYDLTFSEGYNSIAATPEPGSLALLGTGMAGLMGLRRKRRV